MTLLTGMTATQSAALWSGLLILLLVILSVRVVQARRKHRVLLGDGGVSQVTVAGRVFGNAAEYVPTGIGALALLAMLGMPVVAIHAVGAVLFAGRLIHAAGLNDRKPTLGRFTGMALTYLALFAVGGMLVVHAFV
ncbi:MAG: MAPEG family protein [Brevundimonas sp.]|uniref:MAPEG family protein n=1 Tax=Brevundimonas sp. TaxID=1871086 RepID=UPI00272518A2|nr:MAPEG family protein [Brevundimonas sp.]MDZ4321117.1 MAPEG family protein [Phenylobacterium sp.]MDO9586586.1 MAPEG family protein [Brevundimonas sp.]MDP3370974.1 MAPEG family protein [Brevundimonas sp.]MDP3658098.1 MAPEG family protein [Brevundimonas sp.]MDZ4112198.1 MAPEG family protein [Brevundimonas sp.]